MSETGDVIKLVNNILGAIAAPVAGAFAGPAASAAVSKAAQLVDDQVDRIDAKNSAGAARPREKAASDSSAESKAIDFLIAKGWDTSEAKEIVKGHPIPSKTLDQIVAIRDVIDSKPATVPRATTPKQAPTALSGKKIAAEYLESRGWTNAQVQELVQGHPVQPATLRQIVSINLAKPEGSPRETTRAARLARPTSTGTTGKAMGQKATREEVFAGEVGPSNRDEYIKRLRGNDTKAQSAASDSQGSIWPSGINADDVSFATAGPGISGAEYAKRLRGADTKADAVNTEDDQDSPWPSGIDADDVSFATAGPGISGAEYLKGFLSTDAESPAGVQDDQGAGWPSGIDADDVSFATVGPGISGAEYARGIDTNESSDSSGSAGSEESNTDDGSTDDEIDSGASGITV